MASAAAVVGSPVDSVFPIGYRVNSWKDVVSLAAATIEEAARILATAKSSPGEWLELCLLRIGTWIVGAICRNVPFAAVVFPLEWPLRRVDRLADKLRPVSEGKYKRLRVRMEAVSRFPTLLSPHEPDLQRCLLWTSEAGYYQHLQVLRRMYRNERTGSYIWSLPQQKNAEWTEERLVRRLERTNPAGYWWAVLLNSDEPVSERARSAQSLVNLGRKAHSGNDVRGSLTVAATNELPREIEPRALDALLSEKKPVELRREVVAVISVWGGGEIVSWLIGLTRNERDNIVAWRAITGLGMIGGRQAVERLAELACTQSESSGLRNGALESLLRLATGGAYDLTEGLPQLELSWEVPELVEAVGRLVADQSESAHLRDRADILLRYISPRRRNSAPAKN